jgi:hypothetical protein
MTELVAVPLALDTSCRLKRLLGGLSEISLFYKQRSLLPISASRQRGWSPPTYPLGKEQEAIVGISCRTGVSGSGRHGAE